MQNKVRVGAAAAAVALAAGSMVQFAGPADAAKTPTIKHVELSHHGKVTAGKKFEVDYKVKHVPAGAKVVLQRQYGTGHVYKTFAKLKAGKTSKKVKAPALGKYVLRVAVVKKGAVLVSSQPHTLYSYSNVALHTLLNVKSGTKQVAGQLYRYDAKRGRLQGRTWKIRKQDSGSCRSMDFTAALTRSGSNLHNFDGTVKLIQEDADAQSLSVPFDSISGETTWSLTGHAFKLTFHLGGRGQDAQYMMIGGTASCYTTNWKTK